MVVIVVVVIIVVVIVESPKGSLGTGLVTLRADRRRVRGGGRAGLGAAVVVIVVRRGHLRGGGISSASEKMNFFCRFHFFIVAFCLTARISHIYLL